MRRIFGNDPFCALLLTLATVWVVASVWVRYDIWYSSNEVHRLAKERNQATTETVAQSLSSAQLGLQAFVRESRTRFTQLRPDTRPEVIEQHVQDMWDDGSKRKLNIVEVGVGFDPAHSPEHHRSGSSLYAPHFGRQDGKSEPVRFDIAQKYTYTERAWYTQTTPLDPSKSTAELHWIRPYYGTATSTWVTGYSTPLSYRDHTGESIAVLRANVSLSSLRQHLSQSGLSETSHFVMTNEVGEIIYPPNPDLQSRRGLASNSSNAVGQNPDNRLACLTNLMRSHPSGNLDFGEENWEESCTDDRERGQTPPSSNSGLRSAWVFWTTVPELGWKIAIATYPRQHASFLALGSRAHGQYVQLVVLWVLAGCAFGLAISRRLYLFHRPRAIWVGSFVVSGSLAAGIVSLWGLPQRSTQEQQHSILRSKAAVNGLRQEIVRNYSNHSLPPPTFLPTGTYLNSIKFSSATSVDVSGMIWQKRPVLPAEPNSDPDTDSDTFGTLLFPESTNSDGGLKQAFRRTSPDEKNLVVTDDVETVGWTFATTLAQPFDYSKYPFDSKRVWIRVWPSHRFTNSRPILLPDIDSNIGLDANSSGIEPASRMALSGWDIRETYYEFRHNSYSTNFGGTDNDPPNVGELYFTVELERNFMNAFISNLIPLIVVALMLFATSITISRSREQSDSLGSNPFSILGACSALFFAVMVSHIQLRREIASPQIMYLEYFYFAMYGAVLFVTIVGFLTFFAPNHWLVKYNDATLPKALFWPALMAPLFVVSAALFY